MNAFADALFAQQAIAHLLRLSTEEQLELAAYCLMPDHAHALSIGSSVQSDPRRLVHRWKTVTAFAWKQAHGAILWQRGFHDRVLRDTDGLLPVARYVLTNPVRAGLVEQAETFQFSGSSMFPTSTILAADAWEPP